MFKVATVLNYFDRTKTALLELTNELAVGDSVKFVRGNQTLFDQKIELILDNHEKVSLGKRGQLVVVKTESDLQKDDEAYKI
jgi:hypothetical protein